MWNDSHGKKSEQIAAEIPEDMAHLLPSLDAVCAAQEHRHVLQRMYVCMCAAVV